VPPLNYFSPLHRGWKTASKLGTDIRPGQADLFLTSRANVTVGFRPAAYIAEITLGCEISTKPHACMLLASVIIMSVSSSSLRCWAWCASLRNCFGRLGPNQTMLEHFKYWRIIYFKNFLSVTESWAEQRQAFRPSRNCASPTTYREDWNHWPRLSQTQSSIFTKQCHREAWQPASSKGSSTAVAPSILRSALASLCYSMCAIAVIMTKWIYLFCDVTTGTSVSKCGHQ
jgi:hypothetical protein